MLQSASVISCPAGASQTMSPISPGACGWPRKNRRRRFFRGQPQAPGEIGDLVWLTPTGQEMTEADWSTSYANSLAVFLNGDAISEPDPRGEKISDARFLLLFNANSDPITFTLPEASFAAGWEVVIDTALGIAGSVHAPKKVIVVCVRAVVVLRSVE